MDSNNNHKPGNIAIKADALTKIYPLYSAPKDRLKEALHPFRKKYHEDFYALKNVTFEIEKGDSLGIIGQNGSGKSTLLKILSKVLTQTSGQFYTSGRVISLLELGSGFNPELTGLENIYFYGTILGFSKKKIESKLDEIISFADIGKFINQPLKTYSSGMRSRLAFSVASHVDPDILILDEVLAVGDLRFKQKCFRVMNEIIDQKRTVILVSHDTGSVTNFCNKALWLNSGEIKEFGNTIDIVKRYVGFMTYGLDSEQKTSKTVTKADNSYTDNTEKEIAVSDNIKINNIKWTNTEKLESFGEYGAIIEKISLYNSSTGNRVDTLKGGEHLSLFVKIKASQDIESPGLGFRLKDKRGNGVFTINNYLYNKPLRKIKKDESLVIKTDFKFPLLISGKYTATIAITDGTQTNHIQHHWIHDALIISVDNSDPKFQRTGNTIVINNPDYNIELI